MRAGRLAAVLAALVVAGCGDSGGPTTRTTAGASLPPAPATVTQACVAVARHAAFPVECPTRWPAHRSPGAPKTKAFAQTSDVYLINADNGFSRSGGHVFHLLLGGQRRPFGRWPAGVDPDLRVTTRKVTIPIRGGGRFVQQLPARHIGSARVHGAPADIRREPAYPQGGLHGGHLLVLWNERGHGYLVSVHAVRISQRALIAIALTMARSTRPSSPATTSGSH